MRLRSFRLIALAAALHPIAHADDAADIERDRVVVPCTTLDTTWNDRAVVQANRWPGGVVPYAFDPKVSARRAAGMRAAMDHLERLANITFVPRTIEDDYVLIAAGTGNSSEVGRVGGAQPLNIASWGVTYIMVHELMHALGFKHEQARPDRDGYVFVNLSNVQAGYENNFEIAADASTFGPYDFESVMHYSPCAFSNCCPPLSSCACDVSCASIQALAAYAAFQPKMGQQDRISVLDRVGLVQAYGPRPTPDGPIIRSGSFDEFPVGTAPNNDAPIGPWLFPASYTASSAGEPSGRDGVFTIVDTSTIQPGKPGRSLRLSGPTVDSTANVNLVQFFRSPLLAEPGLKITAAFDAWIPSGNSVGGSFAIGGDNGSLGYLPTDRAVQISFLSNGRLAWHSATAINTVLTYARNAWLNIRLVINTGAGTYDLYYGVNGGPQTKVGSNLAFQSISPTVAQNFDRVTIALLGAVTPLAAAYFDNIAVTTSACASDLNADGSVDDADFVRFARDYSLRSCSNAAMLGGCPADLTGDGVVNDADFAVFIAAYDALICP